MIVLKRISIVKYLLIWTISYLSVDLDWFWLRFCQTNERGNGIVSESYWRWPWLSFGLSPSAAFQLLKSFDQTNESLDIWTAPMAIQWTRRNITSIHVFSSVEYFSPRVLGLFMALGTCEVNLLLVILEVGHKLCPPTDGEHYHVVFFVLVCMSPRFKSCNLNNWTLYSLTNCAEISPFI